MKQSEELIKIKSMLNSLFFRNNVIKVVLFGSGARDTVSRKSDLDLMIIIDTEKRFFDRYDEFNEIFGLIKGKAIDLLIYTPQELEKISHRPFIKKILKEGITIYEH